MGNKQTTFYHATSSILAKNIQLEGLKPRSQTKMLANWCPLFLPSYYGMFDCYSSRIDSVYLSQTREDTKIFAKQATIARGGMPVTFQITLTEEDLLHLEADDDIELPDQKDWQTSLRKTKRCCYVGSIPPEKIILLMD